MAKNKSKTNNKSETKNYIDILYMTPNDVTAKEIADYLKEDTDLIADLWEEMNIFEIELPNHITIDFEPLNTDFKDPSDAAFIKNRSIKSIYALQLEENDIQEAKPYIDRIVDKFSGFFCADTEDFKPVYAGSSINSTGQ